jgi:hypothetical protein
MGKTKSQRWSFWWTVFIILAAVGVMDFALWYAMNLLGGALSHLITSTPGQAEVTRTIQTFHSLERHFMLFGMPASFLLFLLVVGLVRMVHRAGYGDKEDPIETFPKQASEKNSELEQSRKRTRDQRLFLHLISVLQREGRLVDFFAEDLDVYDDAQIGAAVREIHGTCRRIVEKSLSLKPVIGALEGETVTVEPGFDPGAIKLVGNVAGEPPFSGLLRHRGWQAGKMEMPTFSGDQQPGIIAPAEVEVR